LGKREPEEENRALKNNPKLMQTEKLLSFQQLGDEIGLPVRTIRSLTYRGILPHYRLGHRTVRFELSKVRKALAKREIREVA
jgi:hypothetical protein